MDLSHEISALETVSRNKDLPESLRAEIESQIRSNEGKLLGIHRQRIRIPGINPRIIVSPKQSTSATSEMKTSTPTTKTPTPTSKTSKTSKTPQTIKTPKTPTPPKNTKKHGPITILPPFKLLSSVSISRTYTANYYNVSTMKQNIH